MKKIILIIILSFTFSSTSWSEWVLVEDSDIGQKYVDFGNIKRDGKTLTYYEISIFNNPINIKELTLKSHLDFIKVNCSSMVMTFLVRKYFSDDKGEEYLGEREINSSMNLKQNSLGWDITKKVCNQN
jgi:hypothetical protein